MSGPQLPEKQLIALIQCGCMVRAAWMACGLPWEQWPAFLNAYRSGQASPWATLAQEARSARGLALAYAWNELRKSDPARWLMLCRERRRGKATLPEGDLRQPAPGCLGAAIQELLPLLDEQPDFRHKLTEFVERHYAGLPSLPSLIDEVPHDPRP